MSELRAILDKMNDVESSISQIERSFSGNPSFSIQLSLESLENRRQELREELSAVSRLEFVDICDYRIIPETEDAYALSAVTKTWHDFQDLVTIVFDAITSKPKQRARLDPAIVQQTQFNFGFAYSGSLGVVLTIRNDRLLGIDSELDRAISAVFGMIEGRSPDALREIANTYGLAAVRKFYDWSRVQSQNGISADIKWIRESAVKYNVVVQHQQLAEICRAIEQKSDQTVEQFNLRGELTGFNVTRRTFMMIFPESEPISGVLSKDFNATISRNVPGIYHAAVLKQTVVHYASEKDEVSWELVALNDPE